MLSIIVTERRLMVGESWEEVPLANEPVFQDYLRVGQLTISVILNDDLSQLAANDQSV